jgi:hypothetical protein
MRAIEEYQTHFELAVGLTVHSNSNTAPRLEGRQSLPPPGKFLLATGTRVNDQSFESGTILATRYRDLDHQSAKLEHCWERYYVWPFPVVQERFSVGYKIPML